MKRQRGCPEKLERNEKVRWMFCNGWKQVMIAGFLEISPARVRQILHGQKRYPKKRLIVQSENPLHPNC